MGIPQLSTCCLCFSLRTGTKIIGWVSLVFGIMFIVGLIAQLLFMIHMEDDPKTDDEHEKLAAFELVLTVISLLVTFIQTAFGFVLLLGAYQGKPKLVSVWIIASVVTVVINIITFTVLIFFTMDVEYLIGCVFDLYFILVVYSYYREIANSPVYSV